MSDEDVEVARQAFDSFNRRHLAGAVEAFHPDAEWIPYLAALEDDSYRGRDRIEAMWRDVLRNFPDFRIELVELVTVGADTRTTVFQVVTFRDGRVARIESFRDRREALGAQR